MSTGSIKRALLALLALALSAPALAGKSPCLFGGDYVTCLPSGGVWLSNGQRVRISPSGSSNYVQLFAPSGLASNVNFFFPATSGSTNQVLTRSSGGGTTWGPAGLSSTFLFQQLSLVSSKQTGSLVCDTNQILSGETICDDVPTFGNGVLLIGQTDPSENGLWVTNPGAWSRGGNMPDNAQSSFGSLVSIAEGGTKYSNTLWFGENDGAGNLLFVQIPIESPSGDLEVTGGLQLNETTTKPTCASGVRGTLWVEQGALGVTDKLYACLKSAANTYSWVQVITGG